MQRRIVAEMILQNFALFFFANGSVNVFRLPQRRKGANFLHPTPLFLQIRRKGVGVKRRNFVRRIGVKAQRCEGAKTQRRAGSIISLIFHDSSEGFKKAFKKRQEGFKKYSRGFKKASKSARAVQWLKSVFYPKILQKGFKKAPKMLQKGFKNASFFS